MATDDLTARNTDYSVYIPSMQINSSENVCSDALRWQTEPLPNALTPSDFNYLRSDNRYWTYKYALASAEKFKGKQRNSVTSRDSKAFILGDSGGFQIGRGTFGEAKTWKGLPRDELISAWHGSSLRDDIISWCETNCTYAMTIDIPLWVNRPKEKNSPFRVCSTQDLIDITVDNLKHLQRRRGYWTGGEHSCKYLNVLQGDIGADEDMWFKAVRGFKLDGWSFAGGVGTDGGPYRILRRLLKLADAKLLDDGYDWVHLLKLGIPIWSPLITAMQRSIRKHINPKFTISYDSSSAYQIAGKTEAYYWIGQLTEDASTWTLKTEKFPTSYAYATHNKKISLSTSYCRGVGCRSCATNEPHLPAALRSPIAMHLYVQQLVSNTHNFARRRVKKLFEETLVNHNVYTVVDAMIRANEAVHGTKPKAPQQLVDACGVIDDLFANSRNWLGRLDKNRQLLEGAVGYNQPKYVVD